MTDILVAVAINFVAFFGGYLIGRIRPTTVVVNLPCPREPHSPHRVWIEVRPRLWGKSEPSSGITDDDDGLPDATMSPKEYAAWKAARGL